MDQYIMYLRKSRMDRDYDEVSVEETLKRHRQILTEFVARQRLTVAEVLEEVVSGESLSARPQMQRCLELISTGDYAGVVCMDIDRLSRGSGFDSGYIMQVLQINGCKIVTPAKIYDLQSESDEQFTDLKFLFSRYELRTITKRLKQGIDMSAREGKYLGSNRPYGYEIVSIPGQKGNTLRIIPEEAEVIRLIYKRCIDGLGTGQISNELNRLGLLTQNGAGYTRTRIHEILTNEVYCGKIGWGKRRTVKTIEDGKLIKRQAYQREWEVYDGLHEGIVSEEVWNEANHALQTRKLPKVKEGFEVRNPFATILRCRKCGNPLRRNTNVTSAGKQKVYYQCTTYGCDCMGVSAPKLEDLILDKMKKWLSQYRIAIDTDNDDSIDYASMIAATEGKLKAAQEQRDRICQLLETGVYTIEIFTQRNASVQEELDRLTGALDELHRKQDQQEHRAGLRADLVPRIQGILDSYDRLSGAEKNAMWKEVLDRITYYRDRSTKDIEIEILPKL